MNEWPMSEQGEISTAPSAEGPQESLFGAGELPVQEVDLSGPGQARRTDPETSQEAAKLIRAKATTARVRLLYAFATDAAQRDGLTDEEAAIRAELPLTSEYATRCSELTRAKMLVQTEATRRGSAGAQRVVRRITDEGLEVLRARNAED